MSKMIQIRDVPDRVHKVLTRRAALAGMSLSDYLKHELEVATMKWTWEDVQDYVASLPPLNLGNESVDIIRRARDST